MDGWHIKKNKNVSFLSFIYLFIYFSSFWVLIFYLKVFLINYYSLVSMSMLLILKRLSIVLLFCVQKLIASIYKIYILKILVGVHHSFAFEVSG